MIPLEKVLFLRNVPIFSQMPSRELARIAAVATEVVYPAGSPIFSESDFGDSMYLIVEGEVRIHRGETELNRIGERAYFGEMSILDGEPRSASATAVDDCLLLCISQSDFIAILTNHFGATLSIIRTLTERLRRASAVSGPGPDAKTGREADPPSSNP